MKIVITIATASVLCLVFSFGKIPPVRKTSTAISDSLIQYPEEKHFKNIRQLTFGGDNAEAYFSFDGTQISWQKTNPKENLPCDQIFISSIEGFLSPKLISTGKGRTTCAYFMKGDKEILFASTHLADTACPPVPDRKKIGKYVWPIYPSYDIFVADVNGKIKKQLTNSPGYDAEATVSLQGDKIVFTSMRNGDIDLYVMNTDGSNVKQITSSLGYDGGGSFSPDGKKIVFRASRPKTEEEIKEYKDLLSQNLVAPTHMELFTCNADGSDMKQITTLGGANWAPFFHPSGKKIIFSSNHQYERGFPFNLYLINTDGTGLEKVTHDGTFDAFPMFSPDGKKFIFSSNRNNKGTRDTNLFIADWVE
ncbi:MAG: PD40 domain-containing protein [Bacteroidetes bacterium]|nr:PD40 domain-containing protein [Bacteroidota bacterium]